MNTTEAMTTPFNMVKDLANKRLVITRDFDATPDLVWRAWTEAEILDQWWAPKPWHAKTKHMDFREGGHWLYAMVGPDGTQHWGRVDYLSIIPEQNFKAKDTFCDENGVAQSGLPSLNWNNSFMVDGEGTKVEVIISFNSLADIDTIIAMGFEQGFAAALENLDLYISTHFKLRKEMKTSNKARVTTYLNFPGITEEVFHFYREVFKGEFTGGGLRRFGDVDVPAEVPMDEATKKLIIHAELTIMGGHVLMATDAPESMGFKLNRGNNMHINLEPESLEEAKRLFELLSEGGTIEMPLQEMFWGAYYAGFSDKYGINWMLNYQPIEQ